MSMHFINFRTSAAAAAFIIIASHSLALAAPRHGTRTPAAPRVQHLDGCSLAVPSNWKSADIDSAVMDAFLNSDQSKDTRFTSLFASTDGPYLLLVTRTSGEDYSRKSPELVKQGLSIGMMKDGATIDSSWSADVGSYRALFFKVTTPVDSEKRKCFTAFIPRREGGFYRIEMLANDAKGSPADDPAVQEMLRSFKVDSPRGAGFDTEASDFESSYPSLPPYRTSGGGYSGIGIVGAAALILVRVGLIFARRSKRNES